MSSLRAASSKGTNQFEVEDERLRALALLGQHADDRAAAQFAQLNHVVHADTSGRSNNTVRPSGPIDRLNSRST